MEAGNTLVLDLLYLLCIMKWTAWFAVTMYINLSVRWPVIEHVVLEKQPNGKSTILIFVAIVIKDSQIMGQTLSENLFTDHVVFCYMKRLCHPLSDICHIILQEEGKEKA